MADTYLVPFSCYPGTVIHKRHVHTPTRAMRLLQSWRRDML